MTMLRTFSFSVVAHQITRTRRNGRRGCKSIERWCHRYYTFRLVRAALPPRILAPDPRPLADNLSRLRGAPLTSSSGDQTYPVPPIQITAQELDMNAPPNIDPATAYSDSDVLHWLTNDARDERFIDNIFAEMCLRLQRAGIPVKRATLHVLIQHPQWLGAKIMWADGMREAELARVDYDVRERSEYIDSPANEIHDGATEVRENLERDPSLGRKHAVYDEMRGKGLTDYVAWPLYHTLGKRHIVTFATDRPGGFDDAHIASLQKLLPILALVSEIRVKNRLARTLLETYVGSHAGELILAGATRRGSGTT